MAFRLTNIQILIFFTIDRSNGGLTNLEKLAPSVPKQIQKRPLPK